MRPFLTCCILICLVATTANAGDLALAWEYDGPAVSSFLVTLVGVGTAPVQVTIAPSAPGACNPLAGVTPRTFCGLWPECLKPGPWTLTVQAIAGSQQSAPSVPMTCTVDAANPCACTMGLVPTPPALVSSTDTSVPVTTQPATQAQPVPFAVQAQPQAPAAALSPLLLSLRSPSVPTVTPT